MCIESGTRRGDNNVDSPWSLTLRLKVSVHNARTPCVTLGSSHQQPLKILLL